MGDVVFGDLLCLEFGQGVVFGVFCFCGVVEWDIEG